MFNYMRVCVCVYMYLYAGGSASMAIHASDSHPTF